MATLHLKGSWTGAVGDPGRRFIGLVLRSAHPTIEAGKAVEICYEAAGGRLQHPIEHGVYLLTLGQQRWKLMSLTCQQANHGSRPTGDEAAEWTAELIE